MYQKEPDKSSFQHGMVYRDFKDLCQVFNAKNLKYGEYKKGTTLRVYKFFHKMSSGSSVISGVMMNQHLKEILHKPVKKIIVKKFEKRKVESFFKINIWGADFADMLLINKEVYIKCVGRGSGGFYKFFRKYFVAHGS